VDGKEREGEVGREAREEKEERADK